MTEQQPHKKAGRPPIDPTKRLIPMLVHVRPDQAKRLREAKGTAAPLIREAIDQALDQQQP